MLVERILQPRRQEQLATRLGGTVIRVEPAEVARGELAPAELVRDLPRLLVAPQVNLRSLETGHHPKYRSRLRRVPEILDPGDEAVAAKERRVPRNTGRRV